MDLETVNEKLEQNKYSSFEEFDRDIQKIWKNSYTYNEDGSEMYKLTQQIHKFYEALCSGE